MTGILDLLYHTTLTVVGSDNGSPVPDSAVYVLGTHMTLEAAKAFTATALQSLGYEPSDCAYLDAWRRRRVVYTKAPAGQDFFVGIDTTSNDQEFTAGPNDAILLSAYAEDWITKTDYNETCAAARATEIEGCYLHCADAIAAAKACLEPGSNAFAQYNVRNDLGEVADWPYGEDLLVHAVLQTGENFTVAVRTIPGAHAKHAKHAKKDRK